MSKKPTFTNEQKIVINRHGRNMLVSASAGAGKTTVMIERIVRQLREVDVNEMVIVTFTNLAADEMKARLIKSLSEAAMETRGVDNERLIKQLEKIDSASISTLHAFCGELLRNYFYALDLDPAFVIFDEATAQTLQNSALEDLIAENFAQEDNEEFRQLYKIFATNRKEENFTKLIQRLYAFSRCLVNFESWHADKMANFQDKVAEILQKDIARTVEYYRKKMSDLAEECEQKGLPKAKEILENDADGLHDINLIDLQKAIDGLIAYKPTNPIKKQANVDLTPGESEVRGKYEQIKNKLDNAKKKYIKLLRGESLATLWSKNAHMVAYTEKLVRLVCRFDEIYADYKRQRGGVDYDDLEHLALKLLNENKSIRDEIHKRYKLIFVDEYQDTNPIQEAIIQSIATPGNLFMVGDVKQSIYGFRGCDPSIFTGKYKIYDKHDVTDPDNGWLVELNDNFRSNCDVLDFVNEVFNTIMTTEFGKVDYKGTAQLKGHNKVLNCEVSTRVDILTKEKTDKQEAVGLYDVTAKTDKSAILTQGEVIARRIKEYVGKKFLIEKTDPEGNKRIEQKTIDYGDVVILMRGMKDKALDIYNTLREHSIPVTAKFKIDALENKEIKDLINLFRVVDNPYVDVSLVGACLSVFVNVTEAELGQIRLDADGELSFYERLQQYAKNPKNIELGSKISSFLAFVDGVRFYSRSASVDEVALYVIAEIRYNLYVLGLPNGELRLKKLYSFIDSLKGLSYAQSIDKFLAYVDDTDDHRSEEALSATGAVRMMTMHASKGLEFPIVFVAGLENKFVFDYFDVEQNNDVGLATRYYDFDSMKRADTLGFFALRLANERKQREEEMRLLYVAMTRAEVLLNLVVARDDEEDDKDDNDGENEDGGDGSYIMVDKVRRHRDWVLPVVEELKNSGKVAHLDVQDPPTFAEDFEANQQGSVIGQNSAEIEGKSGNGVEKTLKNVPKAEKNEVKQDLQPLALSKREQAAAEAILAKLDEPYEYLKETEMPTKVVSSALDSEYLKRSYDESQAAEEEQQNEHVLEPTIDRNLVGTAYHKLYENIFNEATAKQKKEGTNVRQIIEGVTFEQIKIKVNELVAAGKIECEQADKIDVELVYKTLHNSNFLELLDGGALYPEKPFMLSIPYKDLDENKPYRDNVILQGVIDLLVLKPTGAVVVDFKYTLHKDKISVNYKRQLNSYKLAVQRILGIADVSAYVLSIADNELIPM